MLHIDLETRSSVDLIKSGVYKYAESPDFKILCMAWDYQGVKGIIDFMNGEEIPEWILSAIHDEKVTKVAFNATFERICLSSHLGIKYLSPKSWLCTMISAAHDGIIGGLKVVAEHYKATAKLSTGKELIKLFCIPKKDGTFNDPSLFPQHWADFKHYCQVDVEAEKSIKTNNGFDSTLYVQSELINDRGIKINRTMCENAVQTCQEFKLNTLDKLKKLTNLSNPNSHVQFKHWLSTQGYPMVSTDKNHCLELLDDITVPQIVREVLETKISMSATSVTKYQKMLDMQCRDGRVRGIHFMNGGATRRFSGKGVQGQNMARGDIDNDKRQELIEGGTLTPDECKALVRSAIEGDFIIADFTSIEKLVMSWLVGDTESLEAFDKGLDLYILSASKIYNKPYDQVTKDERKVAKVAELAFGYQGARGAAIAFGADKFMTLDEIDALVIKWRENNQKIVRTWYALQDAFLQVIATRSRAVVGRIVLYYRNDGLYIILPNGLELSYPNPEVIQGKYGFVPQYSRIRKRILCKEETYGGKIFENIVQSIAFMLLRETLLRLKDWSVVMHIHDEVVVEKRYPWQSLNMLVAAITKPVPWAPGLKLKADGFESAYYRKG
jgi:DNA polymerase bacteriophage-type